MAEEQAAGLYKLLRLKPNDLSSQYLKTLMLQSFAKVIDSNSHYSL